MTKRLVLLGLALGLVLTALPLLASCDSGSDEPAPAADEPDEVDATTGFADAPCNGEKPWCDDGLVCSPDDACKDVTAATGGDCAYDADKKGKNIGRHIKNYMMYTVDGDPYWLHQDCGTQHKTYWMILATGWCGACEVYAKTVQAFYELYNDDGLEVLWVLGSTQNKDEAVSPEWAKEYAEKKNVSFMIVRDKGFYSTYGAVDNFSSSLPHQYVMDAGNMELLEATGGTADILSEKMVCQKLGIEWTECKQAVCDAMGKSPEQCNFDGPDAEVAGANTDPPPD